MLNYIFHKRSTIHDFLRTVVDGYKTYTKLKTPKYDGDDDDESIIVIVIVRYDILYCCC